MATKAKNTAKKATKVVNIDWSTLLDLNRKYHSQSLSQVCSFLNAHPSLKSIIGGKKFTPVVLFNLSREAFTLKDGTGRTKFTPFVFLKALRSFDGDVKGLDNTKSFEAAKVAHDTAAALKASEKQAKRAKAQEKNQDKPQARKSKAEGATMLQLEAALKAS